MGHVKTHAHLGHIQRQTNMKAWPAVRPAGMDYSEMGSTLEHKDLFQLKGFLLCRWFPSGPEAVSSPLSINREQLFLNVTFVARLGALADANYLSVCQNCVIQVSKRPKTTTTIWEETLRNKLKIC